MIADATMRAIQMTTIAPMIFQNIAGPFDGVCASSFTIHTASARAGKSRAELGVRGKIGVNPERIYQRCGSGTGGSASMP
ncbi:hypothetical protein GCM10009581_27590 [Tsukamurella strandjordii]